MLARGGASSTELRRLMQAIFFEAHVAGHREIEDQQVDEAALSLELPEALAEIQALAAIRKIRQRRLRPAEKELLSVQTRNACAQLPAAMRSAIEQVRLRVARDELPLFSLLQAQPLWLQSSHLSFQEYFAARRVRCARRERVSRARRHGNGPHGGRTRADLAMRWAAASARGYCARQAFMEMCLTSQERSAVIQ